MPTVRNFRRLSIAVTGVGARYWLWTLVAWLLFTGCAKMEVPITVLHPAEMNLRGRNQVVLENFRGRGGAELQTHLVEELSKSPTVRLVGLNTATPAWGGPGLPPPVPGSNPKPEGRVVVGGEVLNHDYQEHVSQYTTTCIRRVKVGDNYVDQEYPCPRYTRSGRARVRAALLVRDFETGSELGRRSAAWEEREETSATEQTPDYIDEDLLLDKCSRRVAFELAKTISPWTELVRAPFYKDDDLPMLEKGIELARADRWDEAITLFKQAVAAAGTVSGLKPKTVARAYWDLGLAYEYTRRFDLASPNIRRAFELTGEEDYGRELRNIKKMQAEKEELDRQLAPRP